MRYATIDIETSGLDPCEHAVIEVGYVATNTMAAAHSESYEVEFSLEFDVDRADPIALEINGWGKREFAPLVDISTALDYLRELSEFILVASPAHFDIGFLEAFCRKQGMRPYWSHRNIVDLKSVAFGVWGIPGMGNNDIADKLGIDHLADDEQHRALNDARWTNELFEALMNIQKDGVA